MQASYMLSHGAHLVLTAEDAFNPSADPDYPSLLWPLPGPGMFGALFRKLMEPMDHKCASRRSNPAWCAVGARPS